MTAAGRTSPTRVPFGGLIGRWLDSRHAVLILLAVFVVAWTLFYVISHAATGLHPDLTELYAWSRHFEFGTYKHPPLAVWVCALWFAVFPVTDWSFHLLAMLNAALALYAADLIARRYLCGDGRRPGGDQRRLPDSDREPYHGDDRRLPAGDTPLQRSSDKRQQRGSEKRLQRGSDKRLQHGSDKRLQRGSDKRLLVLLLLLLLPFYQFFGQKFNANAILLPLWPLATYCFLRAFESRAIGWSIAAGALAALAMLGKYYSIYLVAGFVIAALAHPDRDRYLKSPAPWVATIIGLLVLAPHIRWLFDNQFQPFGYAYAVHGANEGSVLLASIGYLFGCIGYIALPVAVYWLVVRPRFGTLTNALWPRDPDRRMLVVLLGSFILVPALTAPLLGVALTSLWTMQGWFLLPVILLAPDTAVLPRPAAATVAGGVMLFTAVIVVAVAPVLVWTNFNHPERDERGYSASLARTAAVYWHAATRAPWRVVVGETRLAAAATFYSADHPDSVPDFNLALAPAVTRDRLLREGFISLCRAGDSVCLANTERLTQDRPAQHQTVEIVPEFMGSKAIAARFLITIVPPHVATAAVHPRPSEPSP